MKFKYKYMGVRGITINDKEYTTNDIVEFDKPVEETGLDPHFFEKFGTWRDKEIYEGKISSLEGELEILKTESAKEVKNLQKIYDAKIKAIEEKIDYNKKMIKDVFEPALIKESEEVKISTPKKIKGGR